MEKEKLFENLSRIIDYLSKNEASIAVVGDTIIDEYYDVVANRVSPEFPIPVMLSRDEDSKDLPGGAANVCFQFSKFDLKVDYFGFFSEYDLKQLKYYIHVVNPSNVLPFMCCVPRKKRVYQGNFPLCRWDVEKENFGMDAGELAEYRGKLKNELYAKNYSVVVYSDYNKGTFPLSESSFVKSDCITIVDPKSGPLSQWKGCTIFKPNAKEAFELTGEKDWKEQAKKIQSELGCKAVVITRGADGVVGRIDEEFFEYQPKINSQVESVIGAGDCFVAFLAMSQLCQISILDGVKLAWHAGSLYVKRKHNEPVSALELSTHIDPIAGKIVPASCFSYNRLWADPITGIECPESSRKVFDFASVAKSVEFARANHGGKVVVGTQTLEQATLVACLKNVDYVVITDSVLDSVDPDELVVW